MSLAVLERDRISSGVFDRAIRNSYGFYADQMNQPTVLWKRLTPAVKRKAGKSYTVCAFGREKRGAICQHKACGAAHAEQLHAVCKSEVPGTINPGCQHQWCSRASNLIDGSLQSAALVVG